MTRTLLKDRTINSGCSPCASCRVFPGSFHRVKCTGGMHTSFLDWPNVLRHLGNMRVNRINHNEIVFCGYRYFLGWTSKREEFESMGATQPCWFVYRKLKMKVNA